MKTFTIEDIRKREPCYDPAKHLPEGWSGTVLNILAVESAPIEDRLWVVLHEDFLSEKLLWQFAVWCARQVQHLMTDGRSIAALDFMDEYIKHRFAETDPDIIKEWERRRNEARYAAYEASWAAWRDAEWAAARAAAWATGWAAAWAAGRDAVRAAARAAAWDAQLKKLRELIIEGEKTGDVF